MLLIHEAAALNMVDLVGKLLQKTCSVTDIDPETGRTPLHFAAEKGHLEVVKLLLGYGARRDAVDAYGMTPIEIATEQGHKRVVAVLKGELLGVPNDVPEELLQDEYAVLKDGSIEFYCPYCREILKVPAQMAGAKGRCRACKEVVYTPKPPGPEPQREFEPRFTPAFHEAARILFEEALPILRHEDPAAIVENYKQIAKAWRSDDLIQGRPSAIRAIVEKNLKTVSALSDFDEFEIVVDGQDVAAAQAIGHCSKSARPLGIRLWCSTVDRLYICGGPDFIPHP